MRSTGLQVELLERVQRNAGAVISELQGNTQFLSRLIGDFLSNTALQSGSGAERVVPSLQVPTVGRRVQVPASPTVLAPTSSPTSPPSAPRRQKSPRGAVFPAPMELSSVTSAIPRRRGKSLTKLLPKRLRKPQSRARSSSLSSAPPSRVPASDDAHVRSSSGGFRQRFSAIARYTGILRTVLEAYTGMTAIRNHLVHPLLLKRSYPIVLEYLVQDKDFLQILAIQVLIAVEEHRIPLIENFPRSAQPIVDLSHIIYEKHEALSAVLLQGIGLLVFSMTKDKGQKQKFYGATDVFREFARALYEDKLDDIWYGHFMLHYPNLDQKLITVLRAFAATVEKRKPEESFEMFLVRIVHQTSEIGPYLKKHKLVIAKTKYLLKLVGNFCDILLSDIEFSRGLSRTVYIQSDAEGSINILEDIKRTINSRGNQDKIQAFIMKQLRKILSMLITGAKRSQTESLLTHIMDFIKQGENLRLCIKAFSVAINGYQYDDLEQSFNDLDVPRKRQRYLRRHPEKAASYFRQKYLIKSIKQLELNDDFIAFIKDYYPTLVSDIYRGVRTGALRSRVEHIATNFGIRDVRTYLRKDREIAMISRFFMLNLPVLLNIVEDGVNRSYFRVLSSRSQIKGINAVFAILPHFFPAITDLIFHKFGDKIAERIVAKIDIKTEAERNIAKGALKSIFADIQFRDFLFEVARSFTSSESINYRHRIGSLLSAWQENIGSDDMGISLSAKTKERFSIMISDTLQLCHKNRYDYLCIISGHYGYCSLLAKTLEVLEFAYHHSDSLLKLAKICAPKKARTIGQIEYPLRAGLCIFHMAYKPINTVYHYVESFLIRCNIIARHERIEFDLIEGGLPPVESRAARSRAALETLLMQRAHGSDVDLPS